MITRKLHAINTIKHRIKNAMEAAGIDCESLSFYSYANAIAAHFGFDPVTIGDSPAVTTLKDRLNQLVLIKNYLREAINETGAEITDSTPFRLYPDNIHAGVATAGEVWSEVGGVEQGIVGAICAADGKIYLLGASKIWKTTDLKTFTEIALDGTITGSFGGIAEAEGGYIIAADHEYAWIKQPAEDVFRKTTIKRPGFHYFGAWAVTADPNSSVFWLHGTTYYGSRGVVAAFDVNTLGSLGSWVLHPSGSTGLPESAGILSDDKQRWVFTGQVLYAGYHILTVNLSAGTAEYGYTSSNQMNVSAKLCKTPLGRIWSVNSYQGKLIGHYSDANGLAFADPYITDITAYPTAVTSLRGSWLLMGVPGQIMRIRNKFKIIEPVAMISGNPTAFVHLPGKKILCCSSSTSGTNLYIADA